MKTDDELRNEARVGSIPLQMAVSVRKDLYVPVFTVKLTLLVKIRNCHAYGLFL